MQELSSFFLCVLVERKNVPFFFFFLQGGSDGKESACNVGDLGSIPGLEDPLEKGMATHSSILAWHHQFLSK